MKTIIRSSSSSSQMYRSRLGRPTPPRFSRSRSPPSPIERRRLGSRRRRRDSSFSSGGSPSPPRRSHVDDGRGTKSRHDLSLKAKSILDGIQLRVEEMNQGDEKGEMPIYRGPEHPPINENELKKIQIDIRRNIPSHKVSSDPIQRDLFNPLTLVVPHSQKGDYGFKAIFDRDEILNWKKTSSFDKSLSTSSSMEPKVTVFLSRPIEKYEKKMKSVGLEDSSSSQKLKKNNIRDRLGNVEMKHNKSSIINRLGKRRNSSPSSGDRSSSISRTHMDRVSSKSRNNSDIKSRLGSKGSNSEDIASSSDRVLNRQELESQRPDVKPWDVNPEFVPRGRNYYEHDDRQDEDPLFSRRVGNKFQGKRNFRGRNNPYRRKRDQLSSMEWKHDKFSDN